MIQVLLLPAIMIFIYLVALATGTDVKRIDYFKIIVYSIAAYGTICWWYLFIIYALNPFFELMKHLYDMLKFQ